MKIILGAGNTSDDGWVSTQESELNLLNRADFQRLFSRNRPTAFLAEHVWEHMTFEEGCQAAKNCYDYLADGGSLRYDTRNANGKLGMVSLILDAKKPGILCPK